jgi:hypothetical protein
MKLVDLVMAYYPEEEIEKGTSYDIPIRIVRTIGFKREPRRLCAVNTLVVKQQNASLPSYQIKKGITIKVRM